MILNFPGCKVLSIISKFRSFWPCWDRKNPHVYTLTQTYTHAVTSINSCFHHLSVSSHSLSPLFYSLAYSLHHHQGLRAPRPARQSDSLCLPPSTRSIPSGGFRRAARCQTGRTGRLCLSLGGDPTKPLSVRKASARRVAAFESLCNLSALRRFLPSASNQGRSTFSGGMFYDPTGESC